MPFVPHDNPEQIGSENHNEQLDLEYTSPMSQWNRDCTADQLTGYVILVKLQ